MCVCVCVCVCVRVCEYLCDMCMSVCVRACVWVCVKSVCACKLVAFYQKSTVSSCPSVIAWSKYCLCNLSQSYDLVLLWPSQKPAVKETAKVTTLLFFNVKNCSYYLPQVAKIVTTTKMADMISTLHFLVKKLLISWGYTQFDWSIVGQSRSSHLLKKEYIHS